MMVLKKVKPMFMGIITTAKFYEDDSILASGIIDGKSKKGALKEYQTVVAVGKDVSTLEVGNIVYINPANYSKKKYDNNSTKEMVENYNPIVQYNFNFIELNSVLHLKLNERDIDFIVEDFEEIADPVIENIPSNVETELGLILPPTKLILPH